MIKIRNILIGVMIITTSLNGAAQAKVIRQAYKEGGLEKAVFYPKTSMKFRSPVIGSDTIYLSALMDSIDKNVYVGALYIYYPKNINPTGSVLSLGFPNGSIEDLKPSFVNTEGKLNYVEYDIKNLLSKLKETPCDYIHFGNIAQVVDVKDPTYFIKFFRDY